MEDTATATATRVDSHVLRIHGVKAGTTHMVISDGNAQPYKFPVTVQAAANAK